MNQELNLLPFNLEEALKNPERVVYRNGEKPLEWHWFEKCALESNRLVTVQLNGNFAALRDNGRVYENLKSTHCYDLMLLPTTEKRYWVNVHRYNEEFPWIQGCFTSEQDAINSTKDTTYIKTISFTI